jgi:hypothetical protein
MADPVDWGIEWLQEGSYTAVDDTQTVVCHRAHDRASPILNQTSDNAGVGSTDAQSSFCAVSDHSFISEGMLLTRGDPTSCTNGDISKMSHTTGGLFPIDPQLLLQSPSSHYASDLLKGSHEYNGSGPGNWLPNSLESSASSSAPGSNSQSEMPEPNIFDYALRELEIEPCVTEFVSWLAQRLQRVLSTEDLSNLRRLAQIPGWHLMDWLKKNVSLTSRSITTSADSRAIRVQSAHIIHPYRPRCLDSNDRYCKKRVRSRDPKAFECTNQCGQFFPAHRKKDWFRHERMNFEDWVCPECHRSLRRKWALCDHLKKSHGMEGISLDEHRRQFLEPSERPCGFCAAKFHDWSTWLRHVGGHFEGSGRSPRRKMSEWTERRNTQIDAHSDPQLSIGGNTGVDSGDGEDGFAAGNANNGAAGEMDGSINQPLFHAANDWHPVPASGPEQLHETSHNSSQSGIPPLSLGNQRAPPEHIYQKPIVADHHRGDTASHSCAEDQESPAQHGHEEPVVSDYPSSDKIPQPCGQDHTRLSPHVYEEPTVADNRPDGVNLHSFIGDQGTPSQQSYTEQIKTEYSSVDGMPDPFPEDQRSRFQHFRTEPLGTLADNELVHRIAALAVSEIEIEYQPFNWVTASDVSCSCTSCERRLHLGTSAVGALPRAMDSGGGCRKVFIQQSYQLQQYVRTSPRHDTWTPTARILYNVKNVRPRCHL